MRTGHFKDEGHYGRKAVWLTMGALLFVPHAICVGASKLDEAIMDLGHRLFAWAHPCLYAPRPRGPAPELAPEWQARLEGD